ncbi:hypothetical protein C0995_016196 [Termitomyces sp. Mi166|nr:hypothetical protein C0995_016196 [Termitomyces sp. Mi166\
MSTNSPVKGLGVSPLRAYTLLLLFSTAQLLDIVNVTAPVIALPEIAEKLKLEAAESQWVVNAYTLTFGAFLLTGGRFSAVYGPKTMFRAGFTTVGVGSIINGFAVDGPMLFVIRALQGVGAAITIPSAMTMIVLLFPDRREQDRALGLFVFFQVCFVSNLSDGMVSFAGFGGIGNMGGLVIGGVISEKIGWKWTFWIMAMVILPMAAVILLLSPSPSNTRSAKDVYANMDWAGLFLITACTLLFVFAVTEGNIKGWKSKEVLPPLIISILLLPVFAYVETKAREPLIPSWIWSLPTFTPLFFIVLSEYAYMNIIVFQMSEVFEQVWNVSPINAAIRIIPFGLTGLITTFVVGSMALYLNPRWMLFGGQVLVLGGGVLFAYAKTKGKYWSIVFPGFIIAAAGISSGFVSANIAMIRAPQYKRGPINLLESTSLVGAIFNANLQIGSSVGLAIITAITTQASHSNPKDFEGYRSGWWFVVGVAAFEALLALVFLRGKHVPATAELANGSEGGEETVDATREKSAEP